MAGNISSLHPSRCGFPERSHNLKPGTKRMICAAVDLWLRRTTGESPKSLRETINADNRLHRSRGAFKLNI